MLAADLKAAGAMTVLLKDALTPNLVQTLEGNPAFVHGGPFANIAHGCNSAMATRTALKLGDYVVTEAGFGADLGAEKFFDIKCRKAGLTPEAAVIVATVRALKMHGGVGQGGPRQGGPDGAEARASPISTGTSRNVRKFGVPSVVAINRFATDTEAEHELIRSHCRDELGVEAFVCEHWAKGSAGTEALARHVVELCEAPHPRDGRGFHHLYPDELPLVGQDAHHRHARSTVPRTSSPTSGCATSSRTSRRRLRPLPDLRRQDPVQLLDRPQPQGRALRPRRADPRAAACRRCRVPGGDLRRDHDHARPAEDARRPSASGWTRTGRSRGCSRGGWSG